MHAAFGHITQPTPGVSMTDAVSIDFGGLAADIERYTRLLQERAEEAERIAQDELYRRVMARVRENEQWSSLADHVHTWSADGMFIVGLQHEDFVSQAFTLEYGDENTPPSPMFRTNGPD